MRRALGESAAALAREFGVSETVLSRRVSQVSQVSQIAKQIAETRQAVSALPIADQHRAMRLADKLMAISEKLGEAAGFAADTAAKMSAIANKQTAKINTEDPMESAEQLQAISALTKIANDASAIPLKVIGLSQSAQKEDGAESDIAGALANLADRLPN